LCQRSRADPNYEISLIGALDTQTLVIDAAVTVHPAAYPTFLDRQNVILVSRFTACHAGKIFRHNYTPFRTFSHYFEK
jgi:hypothetical protein